MDKRRPASKLDRFCRKHRIGTPQLAKAAGVSRQHALAVRLGRSDVRIGFAKKLAYGASLILWRKVRVFELFDLDFDVKFDSQRPRPLT